MRERAMRLRFDWETSARRYMDIYRRVALMRAGGR
jgi:glycogen synthase